MPDNLLSESKGEVEPACSRPTFTDISQLNDCDAPALADTANHEGAHNKISVHSLSHYILNPRASMHMRRDLWDIHKRPTIG